MINHHHNQHTQPTSAQLERWCKREQGSLSAFERRERKRVTKIRGQNICLCYIGNIFLDVTVAFCKNLNNDEELDVGVFCVFDNVFCILIAFAFP